MPSVRRAVLQPPPPVARLAPRDGGTDVERAVTEALERLLADESLHALSVERILKAAGTSRATFYRHFSSKWHVVAAALEAAVTEFFEVARPFLDAPPDEDPVARLHATMGAIVAVYRRHRHVLRAAMQFWPSTPELRGQWLHFVDQQVGALAAFIAEQRAAGRAVAGPAPEELAQILVWSAINAFITAPAVYGEADDAEQRLVPGVAHLWAIAIYGRS